MSRQPLMFVRSTAKSRFPANALGERPDLAVLIGECIAFWSNVEAHLALMLSAIMKTERAIAAAVFLSIRNSRAQREALEAAAQIGLSGRELEMFSAIVIVYQSLDGQRTDLAHGIFAVSEDIPDALLWMDSKDFAKHNVDNWSDLSKAIEFGVRREEPSQDALRQALYVYRKNDFVSLRDEIKELWLAVFLFTMYLRLPPTEVSETEFQRLYAIPPIQRALSRLRED